jgi:hypothetical protein
MNNHEFIQNKEERKKIKLRKVVVTIPPFEKVIENLSTQKKRMLRNGKKTDIKWFEYHPEFLMEKWTRSFCFEKFDSIVHDAGLQGFFVQNFLNELFHDQDHVRPNPGQSQGITENNFSNIDNLTESIMVKGTS